MVLLLPLLMMLLVMSDPGDEYDRSDSADGIGENNNVASTSGFAFLAAAAAAATIAWT